MSTTTEQHADAAATTADAGNDQSRAGVPERVAAGLHAPSVERDTVRKLPDGSFEGRVVRAGRFALLASPEAGYWGLMARVTYRDTELHTVYGRAASSARSGARATARMWRDHAAQWRFRAERQHRTTTAAPLHAVAELDGAAS